MALLAIAGAVVLVPLVKDNVPAPALPAAETMGEAVGGTGASEFAGTFESHLATQSAGRVSTWVRTLLSLR